MLELRWRRVELVRRNRNCVKSGASMVRERRLEGLRIQTSVADRDHARRAAVCVHGVDPAGKYSTGERRGYDSLVLSNVVLWGSEAGLCGRVTGSG